MKKIVLMVLASFFAITTINSQELLVTHYDDQKNVVKVDTVTLGDFVVIKHGVEGKNPHYFQGKVTGLFKDNGTIRVFDYARSERVMPIVGKKLKIDEILAVAVSDKKKAEGRQGRAIVGEAASAIGNFVGGGAGDALFYGSALGSGVSDGLSRQKIDTQNITCEIINK